MREVRTTPGELLTLCNDRLGTYVLGPQVEAPISHLTVPRTAGHRSGGAHRSVRTMEPLDAPRG